MGHHDFEIEEVKVKRLAKKILELENKNLKTKQHTRSEMSDKIIDLIEEEVRKCY